MSLIFLLDPTVFLPFHTNFGIISLLKISSSGDETTTVVFTAWGSTIFKKWQFCIFFVDDLHLRASYAIPRRSFVYKNMVKCFSDKKIFFQFFFSIFDQKSTFLAQNELKNALLGGGTPKIAIFSHFCRFIATHQTIHHTM